MSDHPCEPRWQKLIDRAFVGDLSPEKWKELSAHLGTCDRCRAYHDRLGLIDEALTKSPLSNAMRDRIADRVLGSVSGPKRPPLSLSAILSYATAATAVVVVAVLLPFVVREDEFTARGGESEWLGRPPGVALFCITPPTEEGGKALVDRTVQAVALGQPAPVLPCSLEQELQLAYSTPANKKLWVTIQGETSGEPHWYAPRSPEEAPLPLESDVVGKALAWSTRLGVQHEVGTVSVIARFYDDPMSEDPVYEIAAVLEVRP